MTRQLVERRYRMPTGEAVFALYEPVQAEPDGPFHCLVEVEQGATRERRHVYGVDALQALAFGVTLIMQEIDTFERGSQDPARWTIKRP
jgi:hypothetical protein